MKTPIVNKDFRITLPREACAHLKVKPGMKVDVNARDGRIEIVKSKKQP